MMLPAVPAKPTLPILTNILVHNGKLTANDTDNRITVEIPEARDSYFLLPARSLLEMLKYISGDETINLDPGARKMLKVEWDGGKGTIAVSGNPDDFPNAADPVALAMAEVDGESFLKALVQMVSYTAAKSERATLEAVTVKLGETVTVAAADGFKMSLLSLPKMSFPWEGYALIRKDTIHLLQTVWEIQPAKPLIGDDLLGLLSAKRLFNMSVRDGGISIAYDNITISAVTVKGTPPDFLALIPNTENAVRVRFMALDAGVAVRRLVKAAKESSNIMRIQWTGDEIINFSAGNPETGTVCSDIRALEITRNKDNSADRIAVNYSFFQEYLKNKDRGLVTMTVIDRKTPFVLNYTNEPLVLLMPMFVQWNDEKNEEEKPETEDQKDNPADDQVMDYSTDVEMSALLGNNAGNPFTLKQLKEMIAEAEKNLAAWEEAKTRPDIKAEEADAQINIWKGQVETLTTFRDDNVPEDESPEVEKETREPVAVGERTAEGGVVVAKVDVLTLDAPPEGGKKTRKKKAA